MDSLQSSIERLFSLGAAVDKRDARRVFGEFLAELSAGRIRAAEKRDGEWRVNAWVKQGILLGFRLGELVEERRRRPLVRGQGHFSGAAVHGCRRVRMVPGGSSVRSGAYVAPGVMCMPPMYINAGAYVDEGTMVDSHALVGSCAQVGKRVHLSAAAQIGGVLEPVNAAPVIIEDDVLVGGNCGVYEGRRCGGAPCWARAPS